VGQVPLSACTCILNVTPGHNDTDRGRKFPFVLRANMASGPCHTSGH
jgi:hypothetical protein